MMIMSYFQKKPVDSEDIDKKIDLKLFNEDHWANRTNDAVNKSLKELIEPSPKSSFLRDIFSYSDGEWAY